MDDRNRTVNIGETLILQTEDAPLKLLRVTGTAFEKAFSANRAKMERGVFLAPAKDNDYTDRENYLTPDGRAGFSISADGWIGSLFSTIPGRKFIQGIAPIVRERAEKLVCICVKNPERPGDHGALVAAYRKAFGFSIAAMTVDDHVVMGKYYGAAFISQFIREFGMPYHVFMTRREPPQPPRIFSDYFEAEAYVESL